MKLIALIALILMLFTVRAFAQSEAQRLPPKGIDLRVTDLEVEAENINLLLSKIAYQYRVPISLEVASNDDLLKSKYLKVNVKNGTIGDVLNRVVKQTPLYTWEISDGVIRVFPKSESIDPVLQTLLEVRISHFVAGPMSKQTFRVELSDRKELKTLLDSYGVRFYNEVFSTFQINSLGENFTLDLENVPVRSILNYVIKNSATKYWFIKRSGEDLFLNL